MPKRKTDRIQAMKAALDSGTLTLQGAPLTLGVELPADPSASKDWSDDDDTTGIGPVDDMQPIGRVTPVPPEESPRAREYSEADEEPTLLGPNPTITEDDGEIDPVRAECMGAAVGVPTQWAVGIDWGSLELERKRVEFIDATAIALYGRGFPVVNCFTKAKLLWEQRCKEGIR